MNEPSKPAYPSTFRLRQSFPKHRVDDIAAEVRSQLARLTAGDRVKPGASVAISAGSRGIANIRDILKVAVDHLRGVGALPFLVPAMGSHGGGTAEGQRGVLATYGITEEYCGCPIRATMDTAVVCQAPEGFPVHFDRYAFEADHTLVVGRVKPHTRFLGDIQSGLMKMMLIGLGKHEGAKIYHRAFYEYDFGRIVRSVSDKVLRNCKILGGLAIVENGYEETAKLEAVLPEEFVAREKELLELATRWMPKLPFSPVDILLIDTIGKNFSGTGMDTNVVGRKHSDHAAAPGEFPNVRNIVIRDLHDKSYGNATGIGMSEYCLARVVRKTDSKITATNCQTGEHITAAMIPVHFETDREVLDVVQTTVGLIEPKDVRLMWIANTLDLAEVECSAAFLDEARMRDDLQILTDVRPLPLDASGMLPGWDDYR